MLKKRLFAFALAGAMTVTGTSILAACGGGGNNGGGKEDTNIYYAVGLDAKSEVLQKNSWAPQTIVPELTFAKVEGETNVFELSMPIYAGNISVGNAFKFLYKTSADEVITDDALWARQIGIENIVGCEGESPEAIVKNDAGETVFIGNGDGGDKHNIAVAKGHDGVYKFTLTTHPEDSSKEPEIAWELVQKIEVTHDMYVYGDVNNFGFGNTAEKWVMTENVAEEDTTWTVTLEVSKDVLYRDADGAYCENEDGDADGKYAAVQLYNAIDGKSYVIEDGDYTVVELEDEDADGKYMLLEEGKYFITYHTSDNSIEVSEKTHEMYFIGGWYADPDNSDDYGWGYNNGYEAYPLTENADGTWGGVLALGDSTSLKLYNKVDGQYYPGGDDIALGAGVYYFTYDPETNAVNYETCDVYIVGTFEGASFGVVDGITPTMTLTDDGLYTIDFTIPGDVYANNTWIGEGNVFAFKCAVYGEDCGIQWSIDCKENVTVCDGLVVNGGNILSSKVSTFTVTYNPATGTVTVVEAA